MTASRASCRPLPLLPYFLPPCLTQAENEHSCGGVCVWGGEGGCYRGPYKFNLVYKKCLRERSWEAKWPSNDNDNDDEPPCPRPCSTLAQHCYPIHTHIIPTLNPFWRQLQMELEIMQLEICSARCCVKTPERVPSPPSVCLTLLALSLY